MTKNQKIWWGIVVLAIVALTVFLFPKLKDKALDQEGTFAGMPVPSGWYAHKIDKSYILLTRQAELPNIGETEGWAYGEQIGIGITTLDKPIDQWVEGQVGDPINAATKTWSTINGHRLLRVEQEVGATGKTLTYFLFKGDQVYIFTLFPLEPRNPANIRALEQVLNYYAK